MMLQLSPEQQAVVDYPLLPLRVTAGAGTGKTTTMALRLAALIARSGVEPEQALGITFTNKAAEELADRLRTYLPDLTAAGREVEVTTYHGFARGLLTEFGPLVGVERGAGVITPAYSRQLLREALGEAPRLRLDLTAPGRRVDELVTLAGRLGDHLVDPARLVEVAPGEGDETWDRRREMADVLQACAARKRSLGLVDYADMIALGVRLLDTHPEIAGRLRERYRAVLLDEYQDTNPAQRELLRRAFGDGFPVTAVGDAEQTIYEWRGASLQNFVGFPEHFPTAEGAPAATLPLTHNRRSGHRIVALANEVRARIGAHASAEPLRALDSAPQGTIAAGRFRTAGDEARWIAGEVVRLHDEEGVSWRDIGILFRRHRQIGLIRDALERAGVPVEVAALGGLLEVPEVADLHAWLRVLDRPDDTPALMRILLGAHYRLGLGDLAVVTAGRGTPGQEPDAADPALLETVDRLEDLSGLRPEAARRLGRFRAGYRRLLEAAQASSLVELCRHVLDATGAWAEVEALDDAARLTARLNLHRFLDLAEEWSPLDGAPSLAAFLDYLDLLEAEQTTDELDTARPGSEDAVALLTVHRAKGLEWRVVVLPALADGLFPGRARVHEDPTAQAQFLPGDLRLDDEAGLPDDPKERRAVLRSRHLDQEWRTAYVAVTRARERLICTGAHWYSERRPRAASLLLEMALAQDRAETVALVAEPGDPPGLPAYDPYSVPAPDPVFPSGWRAALSAAIAEPGPAGRPAEERDGGPAYDAAVGQMRLVLDDLPEPGVPAPAEAEFRTSVTGLVTYATCPKRFYWSEVDRLPRRPHQAMLRGVQLHRRIELHNRGKVPLEEAAPDLYDLGPAEAAGRVESGFAAFLGSRFAGQRPLLVEAPFDLAVGGGRVSGRIDAVYQPEPGLWEVVDFKSGRRNDDPSLRVQLQAYALGVHHARLAAEPPERVRVGFLFLGDGATEVVEDVDADWLREAEARVGGLIEQASGRQYSEAPSAACRHCDFSRFCEPGRAWLEENPK